MRRLFTVCAGTALALSIGITPLHAQQAYDFGFGGGVSLPIGSTSDLLTVGPQGTLSFAWIPTGPAGFGVQVDGMYQYLMGDEDALGGIDLNQQLISGTVSMLYRFPVDPAGRIRPYAVLGGGVYNFDVKGDDAGDVNAETEFGMAGGVGADLELTPQFALFLEGRFHNVFIEGDDFQLLPLTLGGRVSLGTR